MNGEVFRAYVEQILAPTLQPGDIVIMVHPRRDLRVWRTLQPLPIFNASQPGIPPSPIPSPVGKRDLKPLIVKSGAFSFCLCRLLIAQRKPELPSE